MSSSLLDILNTGRSSLLAHQQAVSTTSSNISNISTPGYTRRDVEFTPIAAGGGVSASTIRNQTNTFITAQIHDQAARKAFAETQESSLSTIENLYAENEGNIGYSLDNFFQAMRTLSAAPTELDRREAMLSKAEELAQAFSATSQRLTDERRAADTQLDGMIDRVNELTSDIASLNVQITRLPEEARAALKDQRDVLVRELSEHVDISTFYSEDGSQTVLFAGGRPLVQKDATTQLSTRQESTYPYLRQIHFTNSAGATVDITSQLTTGKIGGIVQLRDSVLTSILDRVDALAYDITTSFNAQHQAGFDLNGNTGLSLFTDVPAGAPAGTAVAMALHADVDGNARAIAAASNAATAIGGNDNLHALSGLGDDSTLAGSNSRTFAQELADMVSDVGKAIETNDSTFDYADFSLNNLDRLREQESGVSLDEELVNMMRFQRAYQAGSKIIQNVGQMYDTILTLVG